jgi:antitoxin ParD1/3/4
MTEIYKVKFFLPADQVAALRDAVDSGEYETASEIASEAISEWQLKRGLHQREVVARLRELWNEGKASGEPASLDLDTREPKRESGSAALRYRLRMRVDLVWRPRAREDCSSFMHLLLRKTGKRRRSSELSMADGI